MVKTATIPTLIFYWSPTYYRNEVKPRAWKIPAFCRGDHDLSPDELKSLRYFGEVWLCPDHSSTIEKRKAEQLRDELNRYGVVSVTKRLPKDVCAKQ